MDTLKFNKRNTLVVAHRGLSGVEKENTNSAFVAAGNRSYFGIETDIHKTKDGHFVINHDSDFKRVAGCETVIEESTLEEIMNIVLLDTDGTKDRYDLRPTVLQKSKIIQIIKEYDYLDSVTFISFNYDNLLKVRKILPTQSAQYLFWKINDEELSRLVRDKIDIDIWCVELTEEQIKKAHSLGLKVNCWTVNTVEDGERLASWGIDYITSNILE